MCKILNWVTLCSATSFIGCSDGNDLLGGRGAPGHETSSTESVSQPVRASATEPAATGSAAPSARPRLALVWLDGVQEAEDGRGAVVSATRALAFDVDARLITPGARVPELRVGDLVLSSSYYPRPGIIRFVLADASSLVPGATVTLGHVGEGFPRIMVEAALEVPQ